MVGDRGLGDHQRAGDLSVRQAPRDQPQHLDLPRGEPGGVGGRLHRVPGRGEDGVDGLPVEAPCRHLLAHLRHRRGGGERGAVRAVGDQRGVDVGGRDHPRGDGQLGGAAAAEVAGAVAALVVRARDPHDPGEGGHPGQQPLPLVSVQAHLFALGVAEQARLLPNAVGHRDAAEVVDETRPPRRADVVRRHLAGVAEQGGELDVGEVGEHGQGLVDVGAQHVRHRGEHPLPRRARVGRIDHLHVQRDDHVRVVDAAAARGDGGERVVASAGGLQHEHVDRDQRDPCGEELRGPGDRTRRRRDPAGGRRRDGPQREPRHRHDARPRRCDPAHRRARRDPRRGVPPAMQQGDTAATQSEECHPAAIRASGGDVGSLAW